jgi:hypothetical protein
MSTISNIEISFQLRTVFDLPCRGVPFQKGEQTALHEARATRVRGSRVHARSSRAQGTSLFAGSHVEHATANGRANHWDVMVCAWPLLLTVPVGNSGGGDFIQSEI